MEKRIGGAIILVREKENIPLLNKIITAHSHIIIGRQGIPLRDKEVSLISLVLEGTTDQISSLTGQVGRIKGIQIKSVLLKNS
ncbi:MAG: CopG family transcriptional regulator [Chlorobi bacterium]|nr:CopG family transcriptional regulator [Chlorobiota bacterium]